MKHLIFTIISLLVASTTAIAAEATLDKANEAYKRELYNQALQLYSEIERTQGPSSVVCYNMGNTYYRLKDTGRAILYYERALLLDPSNSDARYNLEFVREKSQINETSGQSFFTQWTEGVISHLSSNTWATLALVSFILTLVAIALYLLASNVVMRKIGFFGGALLAIFTLVAVASAWHMRSKSVNRNRAIVTAQQVTLSTAPREPRNKSEQAFTLTTGHLVTIHDSITSTPTDTLTPTKTPTIWYDVETTTGQRAWLPSPTITRI